MKHRPAINWTSYDTYANDTQISESKFDSENRRRNRPRLLYRLSCEFGSEIGTKTRRQKRAPIRTLLYSKPIIGMKLDAWLVNGHCWHFHLLSGRLVSRKLVTHKKQLLALLQKIRI